MLSQPENMTEKGLICLRKLYYYYFFTHSLLQFTLWPTAHISVYPSTHTQN